MQRQRPVESDEHSKRMPKATVGALMGRPMAKASPMGFYGNLDDYLADWPDS